jgi:hypothetical protein
MTGSDWLIVGLATALCLIAFVMVWIYPKGW